MSDLCPKLRDKNQIWSSWYGAFDPQPSCPVKKVRNNHPYNILIVLNNIMSYLFLTSATRLLADTK